MPERVKEWNATPCIATQLDEQKLQQLAIKQEVSHMIIQWHQHICVTTVLLCMHTLCLETSW